MPETRISVLVPSYNHAAYVESALGSVFAQTHPPAEILVVDDGSTDGTGEIVRRHGERVRLFEREHAGIGKTFGFAVEQASCPIVAFLESDDRWEPDYLAACVSFLERHPDVAWISTARTIIDEHGRPTGQFARKRTPGPFYSTSGFLLHDMGRASTPFARRDALLAMAPFRNDTYALDSELSLRFSVDHPMGYVEQPLYLYRRHSTNASGLAVRDASELLEILRRFHVEQGDYVREHETLVRRGVAKFAGRVGSLRLAAEPDVAPAEVLALFEEACRNDPGNWKHRRRYWSARLLGPKLYGRIKRAAPG